MDLRKVEDSIAGIENAARQIDAQDASFSSYTGHIRLFLKQIRQELLPPDDDNEARTRDQISPREWAEYEWHDVTALGDHQRKYIRGLKR